MPDLTGTTTAQCPTCRGTHHRVPLLVGPNAPDDWARAGKGERLESVLTNDVCILTHSGITSHYLRGHLQLPMSEPGAESFIWSVWVELDETSMATVARTWSDPNRAAIPPLPGRLANELPYEQPTRGLAVSVHTRDLGQTPLVMVSPASGHALADEQADGIGMHRAAEFSALLHH